jgi:prophage antirepressor-like protein
MRDLLPFVFNDENVRTQYSDEHGVLFLNHDVCRVLEYTNPREMAANLDDDEKVTVTNPDGWTGPDRVWLTEAGVFTVIMRSNKPVAKSFRKEVFEYIKSIGRSGLARGGKTAEEMEELSNDPIGIMMLKGVDLRLEQLAHARRLEELERKVSAIGELEDAYTTVVGWFRRHGGTVNDVDAQAIGKRASKLCRQRDIRIGSVKHERWGQVQTYPESIVTEAHKWFRGRG